MPASTRRRQPSTVTPEMSTVSGWLGVPTSGRDDLSARAPAARTRVGAVDHHDRADALRMLGLVVSAIRAVGRTFGVIVTRSAPAPLIVTSR